jgi:hypothetical protein
MYYRQEQHVYIFNDLDYLRFQDIYRGGCGNTTESPPGVLAAISWLGGHDDPLSWKTVLIVDFQLTNHPGE